MQPATLSGIVTRFKGDGRKLGYPTANLNVQTDLEDGVYFGYATLGKLENKPALIFVGIPTTLGESNRRVEAHILDIADKDYYDQKLTLNIQHYHRPNQTFGGIEDLLSIIKDDETTARNWFSIGSGRL